MKNVLHKVGYAVSMSGRVETVGGEAATFESPTFNIKRVTCSILLAYLRHGIRVEISDKIDILVRYSELYDDGSRAKKVESRIVTGTVGKPKMGKLKPQKHYAQKKIAINGRDFTRWES